MSREKELTEILGYIKKQKINVGNILRMTGSDDPHYMSYYDLMNSFSEISKKVKEFIEIEKKR